MSPRRLDRAVIGDRLREIRLLLEDLHVDADTLRHDRPTRHIVERVLSQIVELAGSINTPRTSSQPCSDGRPTATRPRSTTSR